MIAQRTPLRQRRDVGQIIQTALNVYGQHLGPLFSIAAVVIPLGIAVGIFQTNVKNPAVAIPLVSVLAVLQGAVNLVASAAVIAAIDDIANGKTPDFSRSFDLATERFWTLLGAVLRVMFHVVLFVITIVGIPWGIQRLVRWLFVQQAVMLDGAKAKDALDRSAEAVIGSWWRTLGIWLFISILAGIPAGLIAAIFSLAPIAVSSTATAFIDALLLPFVVIGTTLLYFDLQARKEPVAAGL